jgi:DNA-3-methyladenine glycosylase I
MGGIRDRSNGLGLRMLERRRAPEEDLPPTEVEEGKAPMPDREKPPRIVTALEGADGLTRCPWAGVDPLYVAYHDEEWGVPEWDDQAMFEKLVLDGFQAGLSWITILRKRPAFRKAFDGFEPEKIARWSDKKKDALMQDAGIIRNRAKIEATVALARIVLDFADKGGFARHLWSFVDGRPIDNARRSLKEVPAESEVSRAIAKDLRARGGNFVGPTIVYAFMQATGMVNDHLVDCCRHQACRALARELKP